MIIKGLHYRLSPGQVNTIMALGEEPCSLGCSEPIAKRLAKATRLRPALTNEVAGFGCNQFSLTDDGLTVRNLLEAARG